MDFYTECTLPAKTMVRYTAAPTKYDPAPYATVCAVHLNDDGSIKKLYVQISKDEHDPIWVSVEDIVIKAFQPYFENPCFIQDCLKRI